VLRLIRAMLKAGSYGKGQLFPTERGTPQGGVVSPLLSNILLTPLDQEIRRKGYQLTRYADDWVITCKSAREARAAMADALRILEQLGVQLNPKSRIVHVRFGFELLGYQIKRGRSRQLGNRKLGKTAPAGTLYAYPRGKSIRRFKEQVHQLTSRHAPVTTQELIDDLNPKLRGWGHYYQRAHVRKLFTRLDAWIVRRTSHVGASMQTLALWWLETAAADQAVWRDGAC
jgi:RNA-directed DNA polymerase